jgi:hypothetical protein
MFSKKVKIKNNTLNKSDQTCLTSRVADLIHEEIRIRWFSWVGSLDVERG